MLLHYYLVAYQLKINKLVCGNDLKNLTTYYYKIYS